MTVKEMRPAVATRRAFLLSACVFISQKPGDQFIGGGKNRGANASIRLIESLDKSRLRQSLHGIGVSLYREAAQFTGLRRAAMFQHHAK